MRVTRELLVTGVVTVVVALSTLAAADDKKPAAPHPAAPHPAPQAHAPAPAARPAANNAQHGPANNNRPNGQGNNAANNNRGAGNNNNNRGTNNAGNNNNHGTNKAGNNNNNRNNAGTNKNHPNNGGTHGTNNANNRGANGNHRGPVQTTREIKGRSGAPVKATYRDGHVKAIETRRGDRKVRVEHTGRPGERRVVTEHNGRRVVTEGRRGGYMERPYYNHGGNTYVQRTYYVNGQPYAYAYRSYYYGGYQYYGYAPAYYYQPVYYGWAYNPWPAPVYYNWGYYNAPWYGAYNYYYTPYPAYPTASLWLTDYLIAANLQLAYAAALSGKNASPSSSPDLLAELTEPVGLPFASIFASPDSKPAAAAADAKLTPEIKQALADEVKEQIADDKTASEGTQKDASGNNVPPALNPKFKIFVVSSDLSVSDENDKDCTLTPGDIISRGSDKADEDNNFDVVVKSSKKEDCQVGANVSVDGNDLQEMHNHFRETLDTGMKTLADKSGQDGLPKAPDVTTKSGEVPAPSPDSNVQTELQQQQKDADDAEADVPQQDTGDLK